MADLAIQFGQRVKALRLSLGLSQPRLAESIGKSVEWVRRIELGRASPSFETISALAGALGVTPGHLFGDQPVNRAEQFLGVLDGLTAEQAAWLAEGARLLRRV
jgi:transcriptional regulator with XRE-family HTH domain